MKKIELKKVDDFDYRAMLKALLATPLPGSRGLSLEDVRRAVKLLEALERADDVLLLEEADWSYVKARVSGAAYTVADARIVQFADDILSAADITVRESNECRAEPLRDSVADNSVLPNTTRKRAKNI